MSKKIESKKIYGTQLREDLKQNKYLRNEKGNYRNIKWNTIDNSKNSSYIEPIHQSKKLSNEKIFVPKKENVFGKYFENSSNEYIYKKFMNDDNLFKRIGDSLIVYLKEVHEVQLHFYKDLKNEFLFLKEIIEENVENIQVIVKQSRYIQNSI